MKRRNKSIKLLIISALALTLFVVTLAIASSEEAKEKYSNLEKEEISEESDKELKEYYGSIINTVGKNASFNNIATKGDVAIINVTIDGRDRRILTRLTRGFVLPKIAERAESIIAKFVRATNITVENLKILGRELFPLGTLFGTRNFFSVKATSERIFEEGNARLINGIANISLNPIFAETISSYNLYLSPEGLTRGIYAAEKSRDYFVVKGLNKKSNVAFSWLISGIRAEDYLDSLETDGLKINVLVDFENQTSKVSIISLLISNKNVSINVSINESINASINESINESQISSNLSLANSTLQNSSLNNSNNSALITGNIVLEENISAILEESPTPLPEIGKEKEKNETLGTEEKTPVNDSIGLNETINGANETIINETIISAENNTEALEFTLYSTDEDYVINEIASVSGLSIENVKGHIKFIYKKPENSEDETIEEVEEVSAIKGIESVNGSVIIKLGEG